MRVYLLAPVAELDSADGAWGPRDDNCGCSLPEGTKPSAACRRDGAGRVVSSPRFLTDAFMHVVPLPRAAVERGRSTTGAAGVFTGETGSSGEGRWPPSEKTLAARFAAGPGKVGLFLQCHPRL